MRGSRKSTFHNLATPLSYTNFTSQPHKYWNTQTHNAYTHNILDIHQHLFARTELRGSRKSNLLSFHNLTTLRSCTNVSSQLQECKHTHIHTQVQVFIKLHGSRKLNLITCTCRTLQLPTSSQHHLPAGICPRNYMTQEHTHTHTHTE